MTFKERVHAAFIHFQQEKIGEVQKLLDDLFTSALNETKRTAGDKHETALAHLQIDQQKNRTRLGELRQQLEILKALDPAITGTIIRKGSLVQTDKHHFFICGGLGKLIIDGITVMTVSDIAPLGIKLMGKVANEQVEVNGTIYTIVDIN